MSTKTEFVKQVWKTFRSATVGVGPGSDFACSVALAGPVLSYQTASALQRTPQEKGGLRGESLHSLPLLAGGFAAHCLDMLPHECQMKAKEGKM